MPVEKGVDLRTGIVHLSNGNRERDWKGGLCRADGLRPANDGLRNREGGGHAGEQGYEWPYIPHTYDHRAVVRGIMERFRRDSPRFGTIVTDTHNDQDYTDAAHPARRNLDLILASIKSRCEEMAMQPVGITLDRLCDLVRADDGG